MGHYFLDTRYLLISFLGCNNIGHVSAQDGQHQRYPSFQAFSVIIPGQLPIRLFLQGPGVCIVQNSMVGGELHLGKNQNEDAKRKKRKEEGENCYKNGVKFFRKVSIRIQ